MQDGFNPDSSKGRFSAMKKW